MKAKLEYNLPEDIIDFEFAINGNKWWLVAWDLDQWLRGNIKHPKEGISEEAYKVYEEVREELRELIIDRGLNLDE